MTLATIIGGARARLASDDPRDRVYALVRLCAELATLGVDWSEIEPVARELGEAHGIDCVTLLPRVRTALLSIIVRRLAGEPCQCWACRGVS